MDASKHHIIIAGGGAAGLMCAMKLLKTGNRVTLLEASNRLGGRIRTLHDGPFDRPVEAGFEFIHGNLPLTMELLNEANIDYKPVKGVMGRIVNGEWKAQDDFTLGWKELIEEMNEVREDVTVDEFLEKKFSGNKYAQLRTSVIRFAQGFDLADTSKASVLALREEWMEEGDEQYRIRGGSDQLIRYMEDNCRRSGGIIHTSAAVKEIQWQKHQLTVVTTDGKRYFGNKLIITVPLGILQAEPAAIEFLPAIDDYLTAARKIGFGSVVKICLQFKEPFWEEKKKNLGFIFAETPVPTWWTQFPSSYPLLTGWVGGPQAWQLEKNDEDAILQLALQSLSTIFRHTIDELKQLLTASYIANWHNDVFTRGAYSYNTVESGKVQELFSIPIQDTIFFAGEAFYSGSSPGTLEAAFVSAKNVLEKLMNNE